MQAVAIGVHIGYGAQGHAAVCGGLGYSGCYFYHQAWVKRLGNQIFWTKSQGFADVRRSDHFALLCLRQFGNGVHGGNFHLNGDSGGAAVKRTAKDVGKAQDVVDLVDIVSTARGDDRVITHGLHVFG